MQMNGVHCCQLWQWTTLTDSCRNCLVALQTQWQQPKFIAFYLGVLEHHLLSLNSLTSVSVLRCWGNFPNFRERQWIKAILVYEHYCEWARNSNPLLYQDSVKELVNQYLLEFPYGVKRTYNYTHVPPNFHYDTMLAGLCNWRDEFGHSNYDNFTSFL